MSLITFIVYSGFRKQPVESILKPVTQVDIRIQEVFCFSFWLYYILSQETK